MRETFKLSISYDGTEYSGWQKQKSERSIQGLIENALMILLKEKIEVVGASRTDAGVHALNQKAHFKTDRLFDIEKTLRSLNGILPKDIRIISLEKTAPSFHARYSTISKNYSYFVATGPFQSPFDKKYSFHFYEKFDLDLILQASKYFIGTHDFTSFANDHLEGCAVTRPIKTIYRLDIKKIQENKIIFEFEGDGFLYKMVRNIIGTLLDMSCGKISISKLQEIFEAKNRNKAGRCVPAKGLFLVDVNYAQINLNSAVDSGK
jgi:tRNA pseudouridine38-40 synthase